MDLIYLYEFWTLLCNYCDHLHFAGSFFVSFYFFLSDPSNKFKQESPAVKRKRRTAHDVTCPSITCSRGIPPCPVLDWGEAPILSCPRQGVPHPVLSQTWVGYPILSFPRQGGTPPSPGWEGVPHPLLERGVHYPVMARVPLEKTWDQWKYYGMEMGYPQKGHGTS